MSDRYVVIFSGTRGPALKREWESAVQRDIKSLRKEHGGSLLIVEGGAMGIDYAVRGHCACYGIPNVTCWANWMGLGRKSGPIRNRLMLSLFDVKALYAYPTQDSKGTRDMIEAAEKHGGIYVVTTEL